MLFYAHVVFKPAVLVSDCIRHDRGLRASGGSEFECSGVAVWITKSTVKLERLIGDYDWATLTQSNTVPTTSQTVTRFPILGNGFGHSFEDKGKFIFLYGVFGVLELKGHCSIR